MSKNKRKGLLFMTGIISYFIGTGLYDYLIKETNRSGRTLFAFVFGAVILGLLYFFMKQAKPEVIKDMQIEQKDEREDLIRGKASQTTLNIFYVLLFILILILIVFDQELLSYAIGLVYITILAIHMASQNYYEKRM